jgi:hypothetical protein
MLPGGTTLVTQGPVEAKVWDLATRRVVRTLPRDSGFLFAKTDSQVVNRDTLAILDITQPDGAPQPPAFPNADAAPKLYGMLKDEQSGIKLTTIVSRAGIPTSCYVNYTLYDNCELPGETPVSNCGHGGKCYDEDVVPLLKSNVGTYALGYRFIVLHLGGGSHGPKYVDRYPPEFQQFEPMCTDADVINKCSLEQLYNAYDNSILYVDHVLGQVIQTLDQSGVPYVFVYLSDHGESLMEGGVMFHGGPPGMALPAEQAQIPLIVKSSVPISIVERAEYRQPDVYDTVLDLFSIQSATFDRAGSFIKKASGPPASPSAPD